MQQMPFPLLLALLCFSGSLQAAHEILLRSQPTSTAPVISKVSASKKVLLNAESTSAPTFSPSPQPITIPAPRTRLTPDEPIAQPDPQTLPPENVVWQPASDSPQSAERSNDLKPNSDAASRLSDSIMVTPAQTQAHETAKDLGPAKTPRLLAGTLVREINSDGSDYPIQLKSPTGRRIAYVDFSGIYLNDLAPYIGQKVYIRGQIYPLPEASAQLVILAQSLKLAPQ